MKCESCGNESAVRIRVTRTGETCNLCSVLSLIKLPDVYFREPYFDGNLGDEQHPYGQWITSKSHKAAIMQREHMREKGDRVHGARLDYDPAIMDRSKAHTNLNLEGEN